MANGNLEQCPFCGEPSGRVAKTRTISATIQRRHECDECKATWKTHVAITTNRHAESFRKRLNREGWSEKEPPMLVMTEDNQRVNERGEVVTTIPFKILVKAVKRNKRTVERWIEDGLLPWPFVAPKLGRCWTELQLAEFIRRKPSKAPKEVVELFRDEHGGIRPFPTLPSEPNGNTQT